ncbi:MAG: amidoligase [Planctomycetes bacterium]|nr:amidoligase [Planctomycetota bacterium]
MDLRDLKFGVEVETVGKTRQTVAEAIRTVVGGAVRHTGYPASYDPWEVTDSRGRTWKVVADSSLTSVPGHLRAEVVSPVLTYQDIPELQEVVRAVRDLAGARVDGNCGIHIHIDAAPFYPDALVQLAKIVYKQEELIIRALGLTGTRLQQYCKPMRQEFIRALERQKPKDRDQLNRLWYGYRNTHPIHYDQTRYHLLNLHSVWYRGTIEIRAFDGTLHAGKVKAYVQFCLALAAKALNARAASSRQRKANGHSDKYDFRVFALHLGLIGDEFKTCRKHLLANLAGSAAWKNGRPTAPPTPAAAPEVSGTAEETPAEDADPAEGDAPQLPGVFSRFLT